MFIDALNLAWKGLLSIFLAIGVIVLAIYGLQMTTKAIEKKKEEKKNKLSEIASNGEDKKDN